MAKRTFTREQLEMAAEMRRQRIGFDRIARKLKCGQVALRRELNANGYYQEVRAFKYRTADPAMDLPIGTVPPGHPFYELDQEMLRGQRDRSLNFGRQKSTLAEI